LVKENVYQDGIHLVRDEPAGSKNIAAALTKVKVLGPRVYQEGIHLIRED